MKWLSSGLKLTYGLYLRMEITYRILKVVNGRWKGKMPVSLFSIDCNPLKNNEFIVCGNDKDVRLYDQRKISPDCTEPVKIFRPKSLSSNQDPVYRMNPVSGIHVNYTDGL